jgi:hypothetical protein
MGGRHIQLNLEDYRSTVGDLADYISIVSNQPLIYLIMDNEPVLPWTALHQLTEFSQS